MAMSDEMNENGTQGPSRAKKMVLGGLGTALLVGAMGLAVGTAAADDDEAGHEGNRWGAPADPGHEGMPGGPGPMHGGPLGEGRMLHGEMVVEDASGDAVTRLAQSGEVTDVSASSISVTSTDGFSATYVVDGDTIVRSPDAGDDASGLDGVKKGDTVQVHASDDGDENTAMAVFEAIDGAQPGA
ncbi:MAG TPA: hypothetical protein VMX11_01220 [Actinomycetes bacterium]|nr:hypothetical protein [Actinomycetes bacterium]